MRRGLFVYWLRFQGLKQVYLPFFQEKDKEKKNLKEVVSFEKKNCGLGIWSYSSIDLLYIYIFFKKRNFGQKNAWTHMNLYRYQYLLFNKVLGLVCWLFFCLLKVVMTVVTFSLPNPKWCCWFLEAPQLVSAPR